MHTANMILKAILKNRPNELFMHKNRCNLLNYEFRMRKYSNDEWGMIWTTNVKRKIIWKGINLEIKMAHWVIGTLAHLGKCNSATEAKRSHALAWSAIHSSTINLINHKPYQPHQPFALLAQPFPQSFLVEIVRRSNRSDCSSFWLFVIRVFVIY